MRVLCVCVVQCLWLVVYVPYCISVCLFGCVVDMCTVVVYVCSYIVCLCVYLCALCCVCC